ncbi:MAG: electron transfer flavoprotein subunit beta/FixA family protein [Deltaproteobacteria bacterium]|nr:electron transfer flavoprotein subunit beta/FixA family protein [Deltaproteobacteria bacterium]
MLNLVVCLKQVPMVTELPWDEKTGTLRRDLAAGMMNPACKHALEAALQIKEKFSAKITAITMGPPASEEVLREALALGADEVILICDRLLAGSDTYATSLVLTAAIKQKCPKFDLILCGAYTADSETAQVGPQLAEEMDLPAAAYIEKLEITGRTLRVRRLVDNFRETLEMEFPALVTVSMENYKPRYTGLAGLEKAFDGNEVIVLDAAALGLKTSSIANKGSRTKVRKVFLRKAQKENVLLQGTASAVVTELLDRYQRKIGAAIGKSIEGTKLDDEK